MFGRRKKVVLDPWSGDTEAAAIRAALEAGDRGPLVDAYTSADPHRREFLAHVLTVDLPQVPALARWADEEPDSAPALLMRGAHWIGAAWEARGRGRANTVGEEAWNVFFERLRRAEADLARSIEIADDGVGWSLLLVSGRGMNMGVGALGIRYRRAVEAAPGLAFAADQLLQGLCAKWSGSDEEMFAFARETAAAAPDGDPRLRLVPIAHFERTLELASDQGALARYRKDPAVQAEVIAAAERSVLRPDSGTSPQHRMTLNWFAFGLCWVECFAQARPLFQAIGDAPTASPWSRFPEMFREYQSASGAR